MSTTTTTTTTRDRGDRYGPVEWARKRERERGTGARDASDRFLLQQRRQNGDDWRHGSAIVSAPNGHRNQCDGGGRLDVVLQTRLNWLARGDPTGQFSITRVTMLIGRPTSMRPCRRHNRHRRAVSLSRPGGHLSRRLLTSLPQCGFRSPQLKR